MGFGTPFGFTVGTQDPPMERVRARKESGKFKPDDPATPDVNEAWVEKPAKAPRKRAAKE